MTDGIKPYELAFPFFDGEIPEIEGFLDTSTIFCECPTFTNTDIGLRLYVDFEDPQDSASRDERLAGSAHRYTLFEITDEGANCNEATLSTDSFDDIAAHIERHRYLVMTPAY